MSQSLVRPGIVFLALFAGHALADDRSQGESSCRENAAISPWVDCSCVGEKFAAHRKAGLDEFGALQASFQECPQKDPKPITNEVFVTCDGYQKGIRSDHKEFCECAAQHVVDAYMAKPDPSNYYHQQLKQTAMRECGIAKTATRIDNQPAPPPPAPPPALVDASCVKFEYNAKGIAFSSRYDGHVSGDVRIVNRCTQPIALVRAFADQYGPGTPTDRCVAQVIHPTYDATVRSRSAEVKRGLDPHIPKYALFVCLGDAADVASAAGGGQTRCGCAAGVKSVNVPNGETLR